MEANYYENKVIKKEKKRTVGWFSETNSKIGFGGFSLRVTLSLFSARESQASRMLVQDRAWCVLEKGFLESL